MRIFILFVVMGLAGCGNDNGVDSPSDGFDVQIQAMEVTQGIRGDIPSRVPPDAFSYLAEDASFRSNGFHVAERRTIVRVYPWMRIYTGTPAYSLSARLRGFAGDGTELPGSPLTPQNTTLFIHSSYTNLSYLRDEAARSWNFVLPYSWTVGGEIRLVAEANPSGDQYVAECDGCSDNNSVTLSGTRFTTVANQATCIPYILRWASVASDGTVTRLQPSSSEVANVISYVYKTWPIPEMQLFGTYYVDTCVPNGQSCINPYTGTDANVPVSVEDQMRARSAELGLVAGGYTMVPAINHPDSIDFVGDRMGCRGLAGVGTAPDYWLTSCTTLLAQESGHAGPALAHAGSSDGELPPIDPLYPDPHGAIEANAYGFDIFAMQAIPPVDGSGGHTHDYMSYGGNNNMDMSYPTDRGLIWTSLYTWNGIRTWLNGAATATANKAGPETTVTDTRQSTQTEIAAKPPQLLLLNPADGATLTSWQDIALMGQAFDRLDGPLSRSQLEWQLDGKTVGHGTRATISGLAEGQHRITFLATNSNGLQSSTTVTVNVALDSDFDGLPDRWEINYGFDPQTPNASEDPDGDGTPNWREFAEGTNPIAEDTDFDGVNDTMEFNTGSNPLEWARRGSLATV